MTQPGGGSKSPLHLLGYSIPNASYSQCDTERACDGEYVFDRKESRVFALLLSFSFSPTLAIFVVEQRSHHLHTGTCTYVTHRLCVCVCVCAEETPLAYGSPNRQMAWLPPVPSAARPHSASLSMSWTGREIKAHLIAESRV